MRTISSLFLLIPCPQLLLFGLFVELPIASSIFVTSSSASKLVSGKIVSSNSEGEAIKKYAIYKFKFHVVIGIFETDKEELDRWLEVIILKLIKKEKLDYLLLINLDPKLKVNN